MPPTTSPASNGGTRALCPAPRESEGAGHVLRDGRLAPAAASLFKDASRDLEESPSPSPCQGGGSVAHDSGREKMGGGAEI